MIKGIGLTQTFNNHTLFKEVNFAIKNGEKIGLIGRNGTGKSTLFKIIMGQHSPTSGKLLLDGERIGYLDQEFDFNEGMLVGEYIEDICKKNGDIWTVEKVLGQLGFLVDQYQEINTLSGGEKMRLKLAAILYENPTLLLMDEPTNHLDILGISWLKPFFKSFKGAILVISHDRDLLNSTVDQIWELDQASLLQFPGNYTDYLSHKSRWVERKELEFNRFIEHKKRLEVLLAKAQAGIIRSRSGSATEAAKKRIEREVSDREVKQYVKKEYAQLTIQGEVHSSKLVVRVSNLSKSFGEKVVLDDISLEIRGNEKLWLLGANGQGKTTLIKCILGLEAFDSGQIHLGENVNVGYFEQKQKPMNETEKLIDYYQKHTNYSYYQLPKILEKYMFTQDDLLKPVKILSPGQQARLKFSLFSERSERDQYQFLILDEPAQHLDIETKEVVERCLNEFKGAVLLISHDVYSVEHLNIDKILNLSNGNLSVS